MKIQAVKDKGQIDEPAVMIRAGDLVSVMMPDGQSYEITEILTIDARTGKRDAPGRVMHHLTLAKESYYRQTQSRE